MCERNALNVKSPVCTVQEYVRCVRKVCGKVELMCQLGCGTRVRREDTLYHSENECSEEIVMCPYVKYRCEVVTLKRRELKQHLKENRPLHTELKLNILEEHVGYLENKLLLREKEIEFLLEERIRHVGTVEWSIQYLPKYFKPNQGDFFWLDNFSRGLAFVLFPFRLKHTTDASHFNIYFYPIVPLYLKFPNDHTFSWPINLKLSIRVICHMNLERSLLYKSPIIEIMDAYSAKTEKICSIPLSTDFKDFIRSGCLDLEVRICIFKDQD